MLTNCPHLPTIHPKWFWLESDGAKAIAYLADRYPTNNKACRTAPQLLLRNISKTGDAAEGINGNLLIVFALGCEKRTAMLCGLHQPNGEDSQQCFGFVAQLFDCPMAVASKCNNVKQWLRFIMTPIHKQKWCYKTWWSQTQITNIFWSLVLAKDKIFLTLVFAWKSGQLHIPETCLLGERSPTFHRTERCELGRAGKAAVQVLLYSVCPSQRHRPEGNPLPCIVQLHLPQVVQVCVPSPWFSSEQHRLL